MVGEVGLTLGLASQLLIKAKTTQKRAKGAEITLKEFQCVRVKIDAWKYRKHTEREGKKERERERERVCGAGRFSNVQ